MVYSDRFSQLGCIPEQTCYRMDRIKVAAMKLKMDKILNNFNLKSWVHAKSCTCCIAVDKCIRECSIFIIGTDNYCSDGSFC